MKTLLELDDWGRLQEIFDRASNLHGDDRKLYLEAACADSANLRLVAESLLFSLGSETQVGNVVGAAAEDAMMANLPTVGSRLGPYRIIGTLGRGGMGIVYRALRDDDQYQMEVAIKAAAVGLLTPELRARFMSERQILANLEHPHIARLLDGGTTAEGTPYVVMEFVTGQPIDVYCEAAGSGERARIELLIRVARAVEYAHRHLVVHRDLKPDNILVTPEGVPKLLDFGIAKALDPQATGLSTALTTDVQRLMTPDYASPEQVRGEAITTSTDVYQLGALAYRLLTGRRTFQVENGQIAELVKLICETPPERPNLDRDLDQILLHALEKEPARRYASAEAFAVDLERYLEGFPVEAQPDSWKYRTGKFVRRHKVGVAVAVCVVLLIVGFGATMAVLARRLAKQRDLAEVQLHRAEQVSAFMETAFGLADPNQAKGTNPTARDLLDRGAAHINETLKNEPEARLRLLDTFGNAYKGMGLYKQAEGLLRQSLELRRGLYGEQSIEVADALVDGAEAAMRAGDVDDGVSMATESVAVYSALRGRQSEETAVAMDTLCTALFFKGDYGRAEEVSREDAGVWEKLKGPLSLKLHPALNIWAAVLQDKGDYAGAESLYRRQMEIFQSAKTLGQIADSDTETKLGEVLTLEGRYNEAEVFLKQALATRMKMFGTDHSFTGLTDLALARALAGKGDADGAEKMFAEALRVHTKAVGPASRYTASDQAGMAKFDESRGRYAEAKRLYGSALETRVKIFGTESRAVMRSRICMARVMAEQGTTRGVAEMLAEAAKAGERFTPRNPRDVAAYAVAEGEFAMAERRWVEAEASFRRAVSVLEKDASLGLPEIEEARDGLERASKRDKSRLARTGA